MRVMRSIDVSGKMLNSLIRSLVDPYALVDPYEVREEHSAPASHSAKS